MRCGRTTAKDTGLWETMVTTTHRMRQALREALWSFTEIGEPPVFIQAALAPIQQEIPCISNMVDIMESQCLMALSQ
jgi:hypothetical protein